MSYRTFLPAVGPTATALCLAAFSITAHAGYLHAPFSPAGERLAVGERIDAGIDQTTSYARHGNSRGGYTQLTGLSDFRLRVQARPAAPVTVELSAPPAAPIALRTAVLDKATVLRAPSQRPLPSTAAPVAVNPPAAPVSPAAQQVASLPNPATTTGPQLAVIPADPAPVPEPGPLALLALGLAGLLRRRNR